MRTETLQACRTLYSDQLECHSVRSRRLCIHETQHVIAGTMQDGIPIDHVLTQLMGAVRVSVCVRLGLGGEAT